MDYEQAVIWRSFFANWDKFKADFAKEQSGEITFQEFQERCDKPIENCISCLETVKTEMEKEI